MQRVKGEWWAREVPKGAHDPRGRSAQTLLYPPAVGAPVDEVISVGELDRRLKRAVELQCGFWVEGEVGSLTRAASGHTYFTLRDEKEDALIECVVYRFQAQRSQRFLNAGSRVQLRGKATIWAPRGRLQFVGDAVRPAGRGALLEALERLKQKLQAAGLFDPARKRPLPARIRVVGVVTSRVGAAFHDIRSVAFRRGAAHLVLSPASVQGETAPESIVRALDLLERHPHVDVVILGRGGGSDDDLMAFNDERVVRRVAAARVPIVSAVGHEIDMSLVDLAADVRAATPSQAAELVFADARAQAESLAMQRSRLARALDRVLARQISALRQLQLRITDPRFVIAERQQYLDDLTARLERHARRRNAQARLRLDQLNRRLAQRHPQAVITRYKAVLGPLPARLVSAMRLILERARSTAAGQLARLDGLSPLAVLARGYALASPLEPASGSRCILRSAQEVQLGDALELRLARGKLVAKVTQIFPDLEPPS